MPNNLLITPTLLDSFEFALNAPPSWKERAMLQFIQKIRREKSEMPAWVWKGIDFENAVYKQCMQAADTVIVGSPHFQQVANECLGGTFQQVAKKEILIDGEPVLFWGKMDVTFPEKIIDLKTTLKYKPQKYYSGWQPPIYCWATGIPTFQFIVVEWVDEKSNAIAQVHDEITIEYKNLEEEEDKIIKGVKRMIEFLHEHSLYDDYYYTFSKNSKG